MKTTKTLIGRAQDEIEALKCTIKDLDAVSPQTPKIKAARAELEDHLTRLIILKNRLRFESHMAPVFKLKTVAEKYSKEQRQRRNNRQTWNGRTREQLSERNRIIIEHFNKSRLTMNHFTNKYADKYALKPTRIKQIIKSSINT